MPNLKVFTWGYDGWGSKSNHFVRAVDALERKRGFLPPVFVDLRIARQGRAANFKGDLFRDIVGANRYRWMRKLGNRRIETKKGRRIQIAEPEAAAELLDQIVDLNRGNRRVIMFCACLTPLYKGRLACHRVAVADLLLKRARERNLALEVSEWPGERPVSVSVNAQGFQEKAICKGHVYIPLGSAEGRIPTMAVLGWGSLIRFETSEFYRTIITGPAIVQRDQWRVCVIEDVSEVGKVKAAALAREFTKKAGYGASSIR